MKKAEIKRGRHGRFDLFVADDAGMMIRRTQHNSVADAEKEAQETYGASVTRERGRPRFEDERQKRRNITLSDEHAEKAQRIGGNVSEGIRIALDAYEG